jgi:hypothetical protein
MNFRYKELRVRMLPALRAIEVFLTFVVFMFVLIVLLFLKLLVAHRNKYIYMYIRRPILHIFPTICN